MVLLLAAVAVMIAKHFGSPKEKPMLRVAVSLLTAAALGFGLRAWYVGRGLTVPFAALAAVSLGCSAAVLLIRLCAEIPFVTRYYGCFLGILAAAVLVGILCTLVWAPTVWLSTAGYCLIVEAAFVPAYSRREADTLPRLFRQLSGYSAAVFFVLVLIAVFLAGGDGDFLELFGAGGDLRPTSPKTIGDGA